MPKDYAKNNRRPARSSTSSAPGWVWLLTGLVTGAFIMFLVYLAGLTPAPPAADKAASVEKAKPGKETPPTEKPIFEFYDTLMNNEVIPPPSQPNRDTSTPAGEPVIYMLQVASFKKLSDADSLKAQLTLEGMDVSIAQFNNRGEIYHRVMVGPFTDADKMGKTKKALAARNISPIVLQKKPGA